MTTYLIPATDTDLPEIEAFLAARAETSMFLLANLADHGLHDRDEPRALSVALARDATGLTGVFARSNAGFVLLQAPTATPADWKAFARWMQGCAFFGLNGEATQVAAACAALDLAPGALTRADPEPLYRLDLAALRDTDLAPGHLRLPVEADLALLTRWFTDFEHSALGTPKWRAGTIAAQRAEAAISGYAVRLLEQHGMPVAMTAINAQLPSAAQRTGIVQIGGVYTPPEHRNRKAARTAVALQLRALRDDEGAGVAVLSAAHPAACRAYEALGFTRIGQVTLALLRTPVEAAHA